MTDHDAERIARFRAAMEALASSMRRTAAEIECAALDIGELRVALDKAQLGVSLEVAEAALARASRPTPPSRTESPSA